MLEFQDRRGVSRMVEKFGVSQSVDIILQCLEYTYQVYEEEMLEQMLNIERAKGEKQ